MIKSKTDTEVNLTDIENDPIGTGECNRKHFSSPVKERKNMISEIEKNSYLRLMINATA